MSQARLLVAALAHVEGVPLLLQNHGGHNFYTWLDALPPALTWSWRQLASPQLRVLFPLADPSTTTVTVTGEVPVHQRVRTAGTHRGEALRGQPHPGPS
jgi:hypothetical protein